MWTGVLWFTGPVISLRGVLLWQQCNSNNLSFCLPLPRSGWHRGNTRQLKFSSPRKAFIRLSHHYWGFLAVNVWVPPSAKSQKRIYSARCFNTYNVSVWQGPYVCLCVCVHRSMSYSCICRLLLKEVGVSVERLMKLEHVGRCVCSSVCLTNPRYKTLKKTVWCIFVVAACCACVIMCFHQSIVPFKQYYGGGTRGSSSIHQEKTIPQSHWFHFGCPLHNNTAFILACTIMTLKALMFLLCSSSSSWHVLLTHKCVFNHPSSFHPFFFSIIATLSLALDRSICHMSSKPIALALLNCGIKT